MQTESSNSSGSQTAPGPAIQTQRATLHDVQVISAHGKSFGSGAYAHGSTVQVGVEHSVVRMRGILGLLGGRHEFVGWSGIEAHESQTDLQVLGPTTLRAKWRDDLLLPMVTLTGPAILVLVLLRPVRQRIDWQSVDFTRKPSS